MSDTSNTPGTASSGEDVVIVTGHRVSCDGGGGALGHPRVYMDMGDERTVRCKYCDRIFARDAEAGH